MCMVTVDKVKEVVDKKKDVVIRDDDESSDEEGDIDRSDRNEAVVIYKTNGKVCSDTLYCGKEKPHKQVESEMKEAYKQLFKKREFTRIEFG